MSRAAETSGRGGWLGQALALGSAESQGHDLLRLFLLAQVILGHMAMLALPPMPLLMAEPGTWPEITFRLLTRFGPQGAYLFVILSGAMVGAGLLAGLRDGKPLPGFGAFMRRRLNRLVPVAALAILLTALLDGAGLHLAATREIYESGLPFNPERSYTAGNFIGNLLFLQPIFVDAFGTNGPLWTLGYIVQFYVLGWVFARAFARSPSLGLAGLAVGLVLMALVRPEWAILFAGWMLGALARLIRFPAWLCRWGLVGALGLFVLSNPLPPLLSAGLSCGVGLLVIPGLRGLRRPLPGHWPDRVRRLSNQSYAAYAVHFPVLVLLYAARLGAMPSSTAAFALYILSGLAFSLLAAWLVSLLADRIATLPSPRTRTP